VGEGEEGPATSVAVPVLVLGLGVPPLLLLMLPGVPVARPSTPLICPTPEKVTRGTGSVRLVLADPVPVLPGLPLFALVGWLPEITETVMGVGAGAAGVACVGGLEGASWPQSTQAAPG